MTQRFARKVVWTILVAAGSGERFGGPKQLARLGGRTVLDVALDTALAATDGVVLVVPESSMESMARLGCIVLKGGATRSDSVRAGLARVPTDADFILVHDAARPMASGKLYARVIEALERGELAVVPVMPVVDSLKRSGDEGDLISVSRENMMVAQTPQGFSASALRAIHAARLDTTDDADAAERIGIRVASVSGEAHNLKITTRYDLAVANALWEIGVRGIDA